MHLLKLITPLILSFLSLGAQTTDRMIIKYKESKSPNTNAIFALTQTMKQSTLPSANIKIIKTNNFRKNIIKVDIDGKRPSIKQMKSLAKELSSRSDIEYAEPDYIMRPLLVPNDTAYVSEHWHYKNTLGGANLEGAWDITTGSISDTIAVIDTGVLPHSELVSKILPGYDFITDIQSANDDDGRDNNATDSGDWCYEGDACYINSDDYSTSSWHGTHIAGTIAALSNNNEGMTGINWSAKILPLRVLGKGGGLTSDITDAMLWAVGIHVEGVPNNPNPAKVLNLSLGGPQSCSQTYADTIEQVNATGAIVVVAAGNADVNVVNSNPASCLGVITVAASSEDGSRAYYSNYGALIDITAPGGNDDKDSMIYSTLDGGSTTPINDNSYANYKGTSMAAPHIAGIVSLITSTDILPNTSYAQINYILQETARAFPTGTDDDCNIDICGAGIVDAKAALEFSTTHKLAKYSDKSYQKVDDNLYTFTSQDDQIDPSSSWFINEEKLISNDISNEQNTSYQINLNNVNLYDISFEWGVDSEESFDYFIFSAQNNTIFSKSGNKTGFYEASKVMLMDNQFNLDWRYIKDSSLTEGDDNAWIDNINLSTYKTSSLFFSKNSTKKIILITNNGFEALLIESPSLSDEINFNLTNSCTTPLNFQESCSLEVEYIGSFDRVDTTTLSYETSDSTMSHVQKVFTNTKPNYTIPIINYLLF